MVAEIAKAASEALDKVKETAQNKEFPGEIYKAPENGTRPPWEIKNDTHDVNAKTKMELPDIPQWKGKDLKQTEKLPDTLPWESQYDFQRVNIEKRAGFLPRTGGEWNGEIGNSVWIPDRNKIPENPKTNPDGKTWGEILDKYGIEGIPFKDGVPDFSEVAKGEVEIDDFSEDRDDNFDAADEKLAEQRGCTKEEVRQWRKENGYTWHECADMKTMQKVPTEVHGNVPHEGGIAAKKKENGNG